MTRSVTDRTTVRDPVSRLLAGALRNRHGYMPPRTCRTGMNRNSRRWSWKKVYGSHAEALEASAAAGNTAAYQCPNCGMWHLSTVRG